MKQIYCIFILSFLGATTFQSSFAASEDRSCALEDEAVAMFRVANACDEAGRMLDSFVATKQQYMAYLSSLTPDDSAVLAELGAFKEMISRFEYKDFKEGLEKLKKLERKALMDKEIVESCSAIRYFLIQRDEDLQKVRGEHERLFSIYPDALGVYEEENTFTGELVKLFLECLSEEYKEIYARLKVDLISARFAGELLPGVHLSAEGVEIVSTKGIWTFLPLGEFTKAPAMQFLHSTCIALKLDSGISVEISGEQEHIIRVLDSIESIGSKMEPAWGMGAIDLYNAGVVAEAEKSAESEAIIAAAHAETLAAKAATAAILTQMVADANDHRVKMAEYAAEEARMAKEAADYQARKTVMAEMQGVHATGRQRLREKLLTRGSAPAAGASATASSQSIPAESEPELSAAVISGGKPNKRKDAKRQTVSAPRAGKGGAGSSSESARIAAEDEERARVESGRVLAAAKAAEEKSQLSDITRRLFQKQRDNQPAMDRHCPQRGGLTKDQIKTLGIVLGLKVAGVVPDIHTIKQSALDAFLKGLGASVSLHKFHAGAGRENPGMGWNDLAILKKKLAIDGFTEDKLKGIYHSSCKERGLSY